MKKTLLALSVLCTLTACGQQKAESTADKPAASSAAVQVAQPESPPNELKLIEDAKYITDKLKTIPTVGQIVIYTEETDPNKLLARPGQYTSKLNFTDTRYKNIQPENFGTIEIFKNKQDLEDRYEYVTNVTKGTPFLVYQFKHENLLMRLPHEVTPTQAKEYEAALNQM